MVSGGAGHGSREYARVQIALGVGACAFGDRLGWCTPTPATRSII
jgi:hypothetical protein